MRGGTSEWIHVAGSTATVDCDPTRAPAVVPQGPGECGQGQRPWPRKLIRIGLAVAFIDRCETSGGGGATRPDHDPEESNPPPAAKDHESPVLFPDFDPESVPLQDDPVAGYPTGGTGRTERQSNLQPLEPVVRLVGIKDQQGLGSLRPGSCRTDPCDLATALRTNCGPGGGDQFSRPVDDGFRRRFTGRAVPAAITGRIRPCQVSAVKSGNLSSAATRNWRWTPSKL